MNRKTAVLLLMLLFMTMSHATAASTVRFKKVGIFDRPDMIRGEAFSLLVPVDWQVTGGMVWRLHPQIPAAAAIRVSDPKSPSQYEIFPTMGFAWGNALALSGFRQGSNYLGNEVQPPAPDAIRYLEGRHLPRVRGNLVFRVIAEQNLPEIASAVAQAESAPTVGPAPQFSAGRVRIAYTWKGQEIEEEFFTVINTGLFHDGSTRQVADKLCAMRAEKGKLDEQMKLFLTIIFSTRINIQWLNQYVQLCQVLTQIGMQQIQTAGDISRIIAGTNRQISDIIRRGYEERQASQDRINKNWSQYIRGVDEYRDPATGRPVALPSYGHAWVNNRDEYVVTDNPNFNPNVELNGNWQQLQKVGN